MLNGLNVKDAKDKIIQWLEKKEKGTRKINYKLRDWLFSRQRYWGEPFPIIHKDEKHIAVPDDELPVVLPEIENFKPTGEGKSPLSSIKDWVEIKDDNNKTYND